MKRLLIAIGMLVLASGASARTGEVGVDIGIGGFGGADGSGFAGRVAVRGGAYLTPRIEIEGDLASHDYGQIFGRTVRAYLLTGNGVFDFRPGKKVVPYFRVGAGYSVEDSPGSVGGDGVVVQAGFGSRFWFGGSRRAGLRIELLRLHVDGSSSGSDAGFYTFGVVFRLGKGSTPAP